ncbi:MAG: serine--tRNA ligase [Nanoarchaeota archaeon]
MLDIKFIRENPEVIKRAVNNRAYDIDINFLLELDKQWRNLKKGNDDLRFQRNKISNEINELKKQGKGAEKKINEAQEIPSKLKKNDEELKILKEKIDEIVFRIPNIPDKSIPVGEAEKYKIIKKYGKPIKKTVKPHWEIGQELDILDLDRASKLSGTGFYILKGPGANLQRALVQFMLDFHKKNGFTEINPPQIVLPEILFGTGNLPKFEQDVYKTREGLYLIPTAEVPVTNIYKDEILNEKNLPKKFCAFTQCYRTEAGRHGTVDRGIFRLHEFEKVEMVYICRQEDSYKFLEEMTRYAEKILEVLKIPYRKICLSTQDMGFASAKTYDLEAWSPAQQKYLEVSSCSNCTDFQARRMNTRYQGKEGLKFVHTLNGSGLALPRLMISILENYQQKDGSIKIPSVLLKYMNGIKVIKSKKIEKKVIKSSKKKK